MCLLETLVFVLHNIRCFLFFVPLWLGEKLSGGAGGLGGGGGGT